jgi:soluble lytic murein transglycosylase
MQAIAHTLSHFPGARGLVAGAALLASAAVSAAHAQGGGGGEQTAMAVPRIEVPGSESELALPQPLAPSDAATIRRIFSNQADGRTAEAEQEMRGLSSDLLTGTILADRYLGRFHRTTLAELTSWLRRYDNQPEAGAIYALLKRRFPREARAIHLTPQACLAPAPVDAIPDQPSGADRTISGNPLLDRDISSRVESDRFDAALRLIGHTRGLKPAYGALLRSDVARGLFAANRDQEALSVAAAAWRGPASTDRVGQAAFVAGLAAWRLGQEGRARSFFEDAADAPVDSADGRAAAAYWAARALSRTGDSDGATAWLRRAALEKLTFYGLVARRRLGWKVGLIPARGTLAQADLDALAAVPGGLRAFALLQVGQVGRAEEEFRCLWPKVKDDPALRRALQLVAVRAGLTGLAAQVTVLIDAAERIPPDDANFPVPDLRPAGGFRFDPALVYGMTRAESNFDPRAVSPAGARGLMQIMPITARAITGDRRLATASLGDPGFNLELGQRLILSLASDDEIGDSLLRLLASYNAGLGSFASWAEEVRAHDDPLLFIESIPIPETRHFVQRALAFTWIYAARLGLPAPSLDALAAGEFPHFTSAAGGSTVVQTLH